MFLPRRDILLNGPFLPLLSDRGLRWSARYSDATVTIVVAEFHARLSIRRHLGRFHLVFARLQVEQCQVDAPAVHRCRLHLYRLPACDSTRPSTVVLGRVPKRSAAMTCLSRSNNTNRLTRTATKRPVAAAACIFCCWPAPNPFRLIERGWSNHWEASGFDLWHDPSPSPSRRAAPTQIHSSEAASCWHRHIQHKENKPYSIRKSNNLLSIKREFLYGISTRNQTRLSNADDSSW